MKATENEQGRKIGEDYSHYLQRRFGLVSAATMEEQKNRAETLEMLRNKWQSAPGHDREAQLRELREGWN